MKNIQLTFAREYRQLTQTALAEKVSGLSQSNLSKFEKGLDTLSDEVLSRVMEALKFPIGFLDLKIDNNVECRHYRKKASIGSANRNKIDRFISLVAYCFDWLTDFVEIPDFKFKYIDIESGTTPEDVALYVRRMFHLGISPIEDMCNFLERNGVTVFFWDCEYDEFDGVSLITDKGNHLVIVNKNRSNDRKRFDLAHELGHILMHQCYDFFIPNARDKEKEAHRFASELLMPTSGIRNSLTNLKFSYLPTLKGYWLTSMASILLKAKNLGQINDAKYIMMRNEMSRNNWLKREPYDVYLDNPSIIQKAYDLVASKLGYESEQISQSCQIPLDVVEDIFSFKTNILVLKRTV